MVSASSSHSSNSYLFVFLFPEASKSNNYPHRRRISNQGIHISHFCIKRVVTALFRLRRDPPSPPGCLLACKYSCNRSRLGTIRQLSQIASFLQPSEGILLDPWPQDAPGRTVIEPITKPDNGITATTSIPSQIEGKGKGATPVDGHQRTPSGILQGCCTPRTPKTGLIAVVLHKGVRSVS